MRIKLKEYLEQRGISQYKLAQMCEVENQTIYHISTRQRISFKMIDKICKALRCDVGDILQSD